MTIKTVIGSQSPVKKNAVEEAFKKVFKNSQFEFIRVKAESNVPDQPKTDAETLKGAKNRAENAKKEIPEADFWVGIEGGISETNEETEAFAYIYIISENKTGKARTATFTLPEKISRLIKQGYELGEADDIVFNLKDSKKKNGAVGILTGNTITRTEYYADAVILALIPFINKDLY